MSEESDHDDDEINAAHSVQGNRLSAASASQYRRHLELFKAWVQSSWHSTGDPAEQMRQLALVLNNSGEFVLPMSVEVVESFLGHLSNRRIPVRPPRGTVVDATLPVQMKPLCVSYITGVVSAITWLHTQNGIQVPSVLNVSMCNFKKGYKRTIAQMKRENLYPMMEGKNFLTVEGYDILLEAGLKISPGEGGCWSQALCFWPYLVFLWNTIARTACVGMLCLEFFGIANGCLTVKIPAGKCDQDGENAHVRHLFPNPNNPQYCPVLALAMLVWTMGTTSTRLFPGKFPERKFCDALDSVWRRLPDAARSFLLSIGAHSIKKGACTFLNGVLEGPNAHSVELRADHSIGDVRKCYIFRSVAQDQYCGRLLAMLRDDHEEFFVGLPRIRGDVRLEWEELLPGYQRFPDSFRPVLTVLLATLCKHEQWLRAKLPAGHPLLLTPLFCEHARALSAHVSFEKIQGCGGGIPRSIRLSQAQRELPAQLSAHITENFSIQGVAAMTPTMFQAMLTEAFAKLGTVPPCGGNASASAAGAMFHLWADGMYHELPADFELTPCSCKNMWRLYWLGNAGAGVIAYRRLKFPMLPKKSDGARILLSRMHCVAKKIMSVCGKSEQELRNATSSEVTASFHSAQAALQPNLSDDISFSYFYQKYI